MAFTRSADLLFRAYPILARCSMRLESTIMTTACYEEITADTPVVDLVLAAQSGDRTAQGEIVRRYESSVYAIALRRLRNHAEAQELSQEVFIQMLRKLDQLREPACLPSWLRQITHRLAINRATRGGLEFDSEQSVLEATQADGNTPLREAMKSEQASQVRAGLKRLRRLDRETLVAFYVNGQSLVEMSTAFESPVGTIKRRLHVARKRLAVELETLATAE